MKKIYWFILIFGMTTFVPFLMAQTKIDTLKQRVNDFTNTLSFQEWQTLERELKSYEDSTSTQIVVLMINSLNGESIEEFANETFKANKIGQAEKDNGVLLVISKQDHEVKIEVGDGLEGVLTDAISSQIIRDEIAPYFKSDNYFGGIITGVDAIIRVTKDEYKADTKSKAPAVSAGLVILIILFGFFILMPMLAARRRSVIGSKGHSYFSGWGYGSGGFFGGSGGGGGFGGGGGGFGGGGGGGFSGGGGSSSGGGASGSW
jgi:uncharacterized protein